MGRPDECASLIIMGRNPREIAEELGISIGSTMNYLYTAIGKGDIVRSDILFSFGDIIRQDFEEIIKMTECNSKALLTSIKDIPWNEVYRNIKKLPKGGEDIDLELFKIYFFLRRPEVWLGDLYWQLYLIELHLHTHVEIMLKMKYGETETEWWRRIPKPIRDDCQIQREADPNPAEPFSYTNLIDIRKIFEKEWGFLSILLSKSKTLKDKKQFCSSVGKLNYIRNKVMHPVKEPPTLEDFILVREFAFELVEGIEKLKEELK